MWLFFLLFGLEACGAPVPAIRLPLTDGSFQEQRFLEILRSRGELTEQDEALVREQEKRLILVRHLTNRVQGRAPVWMFVPPRHLREFEREWIGQLRSAVGTGLSQRIYGLAASTDSLFMGPTRDQNSLQQRLDLVAEAVSVAVQSALIAKKKADAFLTEEAVAQTMRLALEAYLLVGVGNANRMVHAAAFSLFTAAWVGSTILLSDHFVDWNAGPTFDHLVEVFATAYTLAASAAFIGRRGDNLRGYPKILRRWVNAWTLRRAVDRYFWSAVEKKLMEVGEQAQEIAAAASGPSPIPRFLQSWKPPRQLDSFIEAIEVETGLAVAPLCERFLTD